MAGSKMFYGVQRDNVIFWSDRKMTTEYFHCQNFDYKKPGRFIKFSSLEDKAKFVLINLEELL
jgi:hypothetical protein